MIVTRQKMQYVMTEAGARAIGATVPALESGYYDVGRDQQGIYYAPRRVVTDRLLRLSDTKSDAVVAEIEHFWALRDRFRRLGVTHKRGFLLWGPPGSGKTSTLAIVSDKVIAAGGVVINGASAHPTHLKEALLDFRQVEPDRSLVVTLEDIDEILKVNESTVLAILDGDASVSNVVFLATTNHPEKLEARVVNRPSRFDQVVRIGMPDEGARRQYIMHCDPEIDPATVEAWVDLTEGFSVAQIKEVVIGVRCFELPVETVVARLRSPTLDFESEKRAAKAARNRTYFERFHDVAAARLEGGAMEEIRREVVRATRCESPSNGPPAQ